mmetsp:Transcript_11103/g.33276  ORF Transcript_11103/g.33276 Transcript_11103/m.33276 type:complete len:91 (+) Transcript_11103:875-1147(+)
MSRCLFGYVAFVSKFTELHPQAYHAARSSQAILRRLLVPSSRRTNFRFKTRVSHGACSFVLRLSFDAAMSILFSSLHPVTSRLADSGSEN